MCFPMVSRAGTEEYLRQLQAVMAERLASNPLMSPEEQQKRALEAAALQLSAVLAKRNQQNLDKIAGQGTDPLGSRPPERDWRTDADKLTGETPRMTREPTTKVGPHILRGIRTLLGGDPF